MKRIACLLGIVCLLMGSAGNARAADDFELIDIFQLEYASDPQIAPDGEHVVYVRNHMDIMTDRRRTDLWLVNHDGSYHRPLTTDGASRSPRWSPDGTRLAYVSSTDGGSQVFMHWMDDGRSAPITRLTESPSGLSWSPDGNWLAFSMSVAAAPEEGISLPGKPDGAEWAPPARVIRKLTYRADGDGYLPDAYAQLFLLSAEGGTPRQLTRGEFQHNEAPAWMADSAAIVFSANRHEGWEYDPANSELYRLTLADGKLTALTDRYGPDESPAVSPDGKKIAYLGYDDRHRGYQLSELYVMNADGTDRRLVTGDFDRSVSSPRWAADGKGLFVTSGSEGKTRLVHVSLQGNVKVLTDAIGGTSIGRPYGSGSYSVAANGSYAITVGRSDRPADVAIGSGSEDPQIVTQLNQDLLGHKRLGTVHELWTKSSHDGRRVQAWVMTPPGYDPSKKYPMVLEIHGGPFLYYGPDFAAELQLFAAAGYVVVYANPRGSTSYGQEFGDLIHHNYPGQDYDDLMSVVDQSLKDYSIDPEKLYVTGGSGGGVLTAWIVGKNDRFRAAVVAKPVINWYSFVLTADAAPFFHQYWFPGFPWDHLEHYMARSPLSLVGNVSTPTMLLVGESDYRTPISESEQYYQALKLRKVDSEMVRIPEASHGIASRPSNLMSKVAHILDWFERHP